MSRPKREKPSPPRPYAEQLAESEARRRSGAPRAETARLTIATAQEP